MHKIVALVEQRFARFPRQRVAESIADGQLVGGAGFSGDSG
jgi:hypothetical protein